MSSSISNKTLKEFELRKKLSSVSLAVPTIDNTLRWILRSLKQPIQLFGEDKLERRERTKRIILFIYDKHFGSGQPFDSVDHGSEGAILASIIHEYKLDISGVYSKAKAETKAKTKFQEALTTKEYQSQLEKLKKTHSKVFYTEPENPEEVRSLRLQILNYSFESWKELAIKKKDYREGLSYSDHKIHINKKLLNLSKMALVSSQIGSDRPLTRAKFSEDCELIVTSSYSNNLRLFSNSKSENNFNEADYSLKNEFSPGHTDRIIDIAWSKKGILAASADGSISHTLLDENSTSQRATPHDSRINSIAIHPLGSFIITASGDETLCHIDLETLNTIFVQEGHGYPVHSVGLNKFGSLCASGDSRGGMLIFDLRSGRHIFQDQIHHQIVTGISFHPVNTHIFATSSADNTIKIHDLRKMQAIKTLLAHLKVVSSLSYEKNGNYLASGSFDGTVKLWDALDYKCFKTLETADSRIMDVDIGRDYILTASYDRMFRLYSSKT